MLNDMENLLIHAAQVLKLQARVGASLILTTDCMIAQAPQKARQEEEATA